MSNRRVVRYQDENNESRVAILGPAGRIYTPAVVLDGSVRLIRIANGDVARYCSEMLNTPKPRKACREFLRIGKVLGITKSARKHLRGVE